MAVVNLSNSARARPAHEMLWIEGGEFWMGSDTHYPEERPAHRVRVDGFYIDPCPVTNRQFAAFVAATGYRTIAERTPNPADYPGALPHMLRPGRAGIPQDARTCRSARHFELVELETARVLAPSGRQGQFGCRTAGSSRRACRIRGRGGLCTLGG